MNEIHEVYGTDYPSYSTAKRLFETFRNPEKSPSQSEKKKKMKRIDEIQSVLDENPNASLRLIAEQAGIPKTSIRKNLTSDMGHKGDRKEFFCILTINRFIIQKNH